MKRTYYRITIVALGLSSTCIALSGHYADSALIGGIMLGMAFGLAAPPEDK